MARPKNIIKPNADGSDYTCLVHTQNGVYDRRDLHTSVCRTNGKKITTVIDTNTGEVIYTRSVDAVSEANAKFHIYSTCTDFAKSKNVPRVKIKSDGKHIIDLIKEHRDYLQCSTGSTHRTRGIITVDIDHKCGDDVPEIRSAIEERVLVCKDLKLPLPSSYQIHKTNGHVQLFWVLDNEITINGVKKRNFICDDGSERDIYTFVKNDTWGEYINSMRFLSTVLGGDQQFTGWQIKNMFFTPDTNEMVFADEFCTIWRNGESWSETEPTDVERCAFKSINDVVRLFMSEPSVDAVDELKCAVTRHGGTGDTIITGLRLCSGVMMSDKAKKFYNVTEEDIDESCDVNFRSDADASNMGRNQFVRMKTLEVIRRRFGKVMRDACYAIVRKEFDRAVADGIIKGTFDHEREYTESDFDRDFDSTYDYGVGNYRSMVWTDEQRETAANTNRSKKTRKLALLIQILEDNPMLIRNTAKNNRKIIDIFKERFDIDIKTVNTISNYKRELKLKDNQRKVGKCNYRAITKRSKVSEDYYNSVKNVYERLMGFGFFGDAANQGAWEKRVTSTGGNNVYSIYRETYLTIYRKKLYEPKRISETSGDTWHYETYLFSAMGCGKAGRVNGQGYGGNISEEVSEHSASSSVSERHDLFGSSVQRPPLHDGVPISVRGSCNT